MKLKDLKDVWHVGSNYAILSLPFASYSVQPHWRSRLEQDAKRHKFVASFKSYIAINQTFETEYSTIDDAKRDCELHLQKLIDYLFFKLDKVVEMKGTYEPINYNQSNNSIVFS